MKKNSCKNSISNRSEKGEINRLIRRKTVNIMMTSGVIIFSLLTVVPLFLILSYIFKEGVGAINFEFFTTLPKPVGEEGGGVVNAIIGTLVLITLATIFAFPIGVLAGLFLKEGKKGWWIDTIRLSVEILQSIPSIVIGITVYLWVVKPMGGFSALSGSIALALIMLPVVVRTTEETLNLIPNTLKEASLALGAPYWKTMLQIILPAGMNGILTGILVSIARVAGETAPLLFTAFGNPFINLNISKPISSLPQIIFNYAISPYEDWHRLAWGASFVLILLVFGLNLSSKLVAWYFGNRK